MESLKHGALVAVRVDQCGCYRRGYVKAGQEVGQQVQSGWQLNRVTGTGQGQKGSEGPFDIGRFLQVFAGGYEFA